MIIRKLLAETALCAWLLAASGCAAPTADELLAEAREALAAGEPRTASIQLRNLLQQSPDHAAGRALFGEVLLAAGDGAGAESNLRRALESGSSDPALRVQLLGALLLQGKFAEILEEAATMPALTGAEGIAALSVIGAAHRGLKHYDEAEAAYRTVLESDPQSAAARVDLAQTLLDGGRVGEAREIVALVNAEQPDYSPALLLLGNIEVAAGESAAAERYFTAALEIEGAGVRGAGYLLAMAPLIEVQLAQRNVAAAAANADDLLAFAPQNPIARYLKARIEVERGEVDAAELRLEPLMAEYPEYWPTYALLGTINVQQQQLGQAEMYLRTAVNNMPQNDGARLLLAEVYLQQNNLGAARELLAANRMASGGGVAAALAARASLAAGQRDLAAEYFDRSEQGSPPTLREVIQLSNVYVAAGELDRAARVLQNAPTDTAEAAQMVGSLLTMVQARRGEIDAAAATADRLIAEMPAATWPLTLRAAVAAIAEDYAAARRFYEAALQLEAEHVPALLGLARVAAAQRDNDEAARQLRRVIAIDPAQVNAIFGMAQLAVERGDLAEAETWLTSAPPSAPRWQLLGDLYVNQGRFPEAADAYARAFDFAPSGELANRRYFAARRAGLANPEAPLEAWLRDHPTDAPAAFALATLALERNEHDAAIELYEKVLEADPRHAAALNNLAWLYDQRGDSRALDVAMRAREALPSDASVADTLGWLYVQRSDAARGLPLLEEAVRARPDHPEIRYHYAVALAETGSRPRAVSLLRELLAEPEEFPGRAAAQERLEDLETAAP